MGFNIIVYAFPDPFREDFWQCDRFLERTFYNFVVSHDNFGERSILIRAGAYFGVDLKPLSRLLYAGEDPLHEEWAAHAQPLSPLLSVLKTFAAGVQQDPRVCEKIDYQARDSAEYFDLNQLTAMEEEFSSGLMADLKRIAEANRRAWSENPNPWNAYFVEGRILEDLKAIITTLECLQSKGVEMVCLTAG